MNTGNRCAILSRFTFHVSSAWRSAVLALALGCLLLPHLSGCAALGLAAQALPPATIPPKYTNLQNQSVAVMVWADDVGTRVDWATIQPDMARAIQSKLASAEKKDKAKELKGTRFPERAESIFRYQEEHPELAADDIVDVAPKLNVSRVIYIEIESFQTRSDAAVDLFRGSMSGSLKVIEVYNGKGRVAYSEENIRVVYPPKSPEEGMPDLNDFAVYRGTINAFATQVYNRFVAHPEEDKYDLDESGH